MKKQLLLVDDDVTMVKLFCLLAEKNGWEYDSAMNLNELESRVIADLIKKIVDSKENQRDITCV